MDGGTTVKNLNGGGRRRKMFTRSFQKDGLKKIAVSQKKILKKEPFSASKNSASEIRQIFLFRELTLNEKKLPFFAPGDREITWKKKHFLDFFKYVNQTDF